jgi:hypothetical protein
MAALAQRAFFTSGLSTITRAGSGSMAGRYWNGLIDVAMQPRAALYRQSRGLAPDSKSALARCRTRCRHQEPSPINANLDRVDGAFQPEIADRIAPHYRYLEVRKGLAAGESRIRTAGPSYEGGVGRSGQTRAAEAASKTLRKRFHRNPTPGRPSSLFISERRQGVVQDPAFRRPDPR